jgi:hypothetical protein
MRPKTKPPAPTDPDYPPRHPFTQDEWDTHVASQAARPRCAACGQPLLLIQPGRKRCEACRIEDNRKAVS